MNAYAPDKCGQSSCQAAYLQFVVSYSSSTVEFSEEYWSVSSSDLFGAASQINYPVPSNDFANGMTIQVGVLENSTDNVIGSTLQINGTKGNNLVSSMVMNSAGAVINGHSGVWEEYASPIVGWEVQLVGFGGASTATFTHASGEFSYGSNVPLTYANSASGVDYVEYNQSVAGTAEKSNVAYGSPSQGGTSTSTSQTSITSGACENCLSTTTTQVVPYSVQKGQFGTDLGTFNKSTSLQGYSFGGQRGELLNMDVPSGCLPADIFYNASLTSLVCPNLTLFFRPLPSISEGGGIVGYQPTLITIQGTGPGLVCIPLTSVAQIQFNQTEDPDQALVQGSAIFDWSDIPLSYEPSFNSQTNQLCFSTPSGNYVVDPLALDGSGTCTASTMTCNASLTTSSSPDVIYVSEHADGNSCTTPTASGLTFTLRVNSHGGDGDCAAGYYAIASATISENIACNWTMSIAEACSVLGISGANTVSPFDSNGAIPCSSNGNTGPTTVPACTISTSNANDFLIVGASSGNSHSTWTAGGSFSTVGLTCVSGWGRGCDAYEIVSSTQSSASVGFTFSSPDHFWDAYADAIVKASPTGPSIIQDQVCTGTGTTATCAFGSNTLSGDTSLAIFGDAAVSTGVSTMTDSQGNSYSSIVSKDTATIGDIEGWFACTTLRAAADTVTATTSVSVSWAIVLYELSPTDCAPSSSTGTGTATTSASVGSYTPINPSLVIGAMNCVNLSGCAPIGYGSGYTGDKLGAPGGGFTEVATEHITNLGTGETTPFTMFTGSSYNEISMAFQTQTTVVTETRTSTPTLPLNVAYSQTKEVFPSWTPTLGFSVAYNGIKSLVRGWTPTLPFSVTYAQHKIVTVADIVSFPFTVTYATILKLNLDDIVSFPFSVVWVATSTAVSGNTGSGCTLLSCVITSTTTSIVSSSITTTAKASAPILKTPGALLIAVLILILFLVVNMYQRSKSQRTEKQLNDRTDSDSKKKNRDKRQEREGKKVKKDNRKGLTK